MFGWQDFLPKVVKKFSFNELKEDGEVDTPSIKSRRVHSVGLTLFREKFKWIPLSATICFALNLIPNKMKWPRTFLNNSPEDEKENEIIVGSRIVNIDSFMNGNGEV